MRYRVVCDTNILISALIFPGGAPDKILKLARIGEISLYASPFILNEFSKVLKEKFHYKPREAQEILDKIRDISKTVKPKQKISVVKEDPSDNRILECAIEAKANCIISGDKHLKSLATFRDIVILSATDFIKLY